MKRVATEALPRRLPQEQDEQGLVGSGLPRPRVTLYKWWLWVLAEGQHHKHTGVTDGVAKKHGVGVGTLLTPSLLLLRLRTGSHISK